MMSLRSCRHDVAVLGTCDSLY